MYIKYKYIYKNIDTNIYSNRYRISCFHRVLTVVYNKVKRSQGNLLALALNLPVQLAFSQTM